MAFAAEEQDLKAEEALLVARYGPGYRNYVSAFGSSSVGLNGGSAYASSATYPFGTSVASVFPGNYAPNYISSYPTGYNYRTYPSYSRGVYGIGFQ